MNTDDLAQALDARFTKQALEEQLRISKAAKGPQLKECVECGLQSQRNEEMHIGVVFAVWGARKNLNLGEDDNAGIKHRSSCRYHN